MINEVIEFLCVNGLLDSHRDISINVTLGRSLILETVDTTGAHLVTKLNPNNSLVDEFSALEQAHLKMPEIVPRPMLVGTLPAGHVLVMAGVRFRPLRLQRMLPLEKFVVSDLRRFFHAQNEYFRCSRGAGKHSDLLAESFENLSDPEIRRTLTRYLTRVASSHIDQLPHVRQHGDFVRNNIGVAREHIAVFDWEDFGKVTLPGFDAVMLIVSCLRHDVDAIEYFFQLGRPRFLNRILEDIAVYLHIDRKTLRTLLPIFYGKFLALKESGDYGRRIAEIARGNIVRLC